MANYAKRAMRAEGGGSFTKVASLSQTAGTQASRVRPASTMYLHLASCPRSVEDVDAFRFRIGSDEYLVFSFAWEAQRTEFSPPADLTEAETDVVRRIVEGYSNARIAAARGVSPRTIANQVSAIFRKLGVASRRELAAVNQKKALPAHE